MKKLTSILFILSFSIGAFAQHFEEPKIDGSKFDTLKVKVGGDFALQYQILHHHADSALIPLGTGFNLPTANLNVDAYLAKGIKVDLVTYLSARHHNEAWVKGGYLIIDEMPFFKSAAIDNLMKYLTFKVGDMELDYGDAHYRRSDNGHVIDNPFVGNYVMDAFTTTPSAEVMFRDKGIIAMAAVTTGSLKQSLTTYSAATKKYQAYNAADYLGYYGKIGYDKQLAERIRLRATASIFHSAGAYSNTLYGGDRTGSRYYLVMNRKTFSASDVDITANHLSGEWSPGSTYSDNSEMINLFVKAYGVELFGTYEQAEYLNSVKHFNKFTQYAVEGLYNIGKKEHYYVGARYNLVTDLSGMKVTRKQAAIGWRMTKNVEAKVEYMTQRYQKFNTQYGGNAGFDGLMVEAAISF